MKKALSIIFLLVSLTTFSQGFQKGTKNLNLGLNLGYGIGVVGTVDVGVTDNVSIGAGATFSNYAYSGYGSSGFYSVGGRASYHLGKLLEDAASVNADKFDLYLGLNLGYQNFTTKYSYYSGGVYWGGHAGIRYALKEKLAVYGEAGWPMSSIGVSFKF